MKAFKQRSAGENCTIYIGPIYLEDHLESDVSQLTLIKFERNTCILEDGTVVLIAPVPGHCLNFTFRNLIYLL